MKQENKEIRVVIDTNVFISGLNFVGNEREVLDLMRKAAFKTFISVFILDEIKEVLLRKFTWDKERTEQALWLIREKAILIQPARSVGIIKANFADNRILECALEARAHFLISGDKKHILPLKKFKDTQILSAVKFLEIF